ncbi:translation initiation factor IF-2 subunit gamma [Candidatus Woesearchaeota archaeon]|nr:translation initiation factor IF-2 subunit gamma [Candidatus Woesearchaeota archaeon]
MADKDKLQPEINIGMVGHVDHGKTTLVKALSGIWTDTHSEEIKRGITIRLGYADAVFYRCEKCKKFVVSKKCSCGGKASVVRKVSFVDAPGHESLMATMLSGATIMDGAILLIAANETCPQPQTREHLMALKISGIKNVVVVQNKIDTVSKEDAVKNYKEIKAFLKGTDYEKSHVIPVSAQQNINVDVLIEGIEKTIPTPKRDPKANPLMFVARSFDINKPGAAPDSLVGGVLGGALKQGVLRVGEEIEIKPGLGIEDKNQKKWIPIKTVIADLKTGGKSVKEVGPGGSIGVMTALDNTVVKSDSLAGSVVGLHGQLPPVWNDLSLDVHLLERVVGAEEDLKVEAIKMKEPLMLNVNSAATVGVVTELGKDSVKCILKLPVCADVGSNVTISRRIGTRFRLIGYGVIKE